MSEESSYTSLLDQCQRNCVVEGGSLISINTPYMLEEVYNLTTAIGEYLHIYPNMNIYYTNLV